MGEITLQVKYCLCERCNHKWQPRAGKSIPLICPKCKTPYWNRARRDKK